MESYIFYASNGKFGYLQIESDQENCTLLLNRGIYGYYEIIKTKISKAKQQIDSPHAQLSWITSSDPMDIMISVLCWVNGRNEYIPVNGAFKNLNPGEYYPRSIRDSAQLSGVISAPPYSEKEVLNEIRSFSSIASGLIKIFDYIEPETANLNTYSNKLRELLTLACAEVEYLWLKYLEANSYPTKSMYYTSDYVKCLPHLKLNDYEVQLLSFPSLGSFKPFELWNMHQPTQSLSWYKAYNSVKHNRGANMQNATLEAVINSVAAVNILLKAQHGYSEFGSVMDMPNIDIFRTTTQPTWSINEVAMPIFNASGGNWTNPINIIF